MIIGCRYSSLSDFRRIHCTVAQISRKLFIPYASVGRVLKNFELSGRDIDKITAKKKRSYRVIPDAIKEQLLSQRLLQLWSPYSILERTKLLA